MTGADHGGGQDQSDRAIEPEDVAPVAERQHDGAVERPEDAAELLDRADDAERQPAPGWRPHVGDQREGRRYEATAAHALDEATSNHAVEVVGGGRYDRADREDQHRAEEHGDAAAQIGNAADQGEDADVAEQEPRQDRRRLLQLVDVKTGRAHHVGQREDDDIRVGGGERDRDGRESQQSARGGRAATCAREAHGLVMVTGVAEVETLTV